jgi:hypothetical protein
MASLRPKELELFLKDDDELTEVEHRRLKRKEKKSKTSLPKYKKPEIHEDNGGDRFDY